MVEKIMRFDPKSNIISIKSTLKEVLEVLNASPIGIVFFIDESQRVKGIMTDGDVRRAVLAGAGLQDSAERYMIRNFVSGKTSNSRGENLKLLNDTCRHLPVLDEEGRLGDFVSFTEFCWLPVMEPTLFGNEMAYVQDCIKTNWISSQGSYVGKFEDAFAAYHGIDYALTTTNGTTALHLALTALGVKAGDEVIVPDLTFAASANVVVHCGATPVFVDIDPNCWNIDPAKIEAAITPRTKAIMPVHLYGHPCDMDPILEIARRHDLSVVEDCAEALGARYKGRLVGILGDVGCFSFFSNKVITTGEGGMVVTRNPELKEKMLILRDHGMSRERRYWHEVVGFNYRMTNLQAAIGLAQLEQIELFLNKRKNLAQSYSARLKDLPGITLPPAMPWAETVCWMYSVLINAEEAGIYRDNLMLALKREGIETRPFFYPLHLMPPYLSYGQDHPVSRAVSSRGISLPSSYKLSLAETERVADNIKKILDNAAKFDDNEISN
jgi:perosamine synthetase